MMQHCKDENIDPTEIVEKEDGYWHHDHAFFFWEKTVRITKSIRTQQFAKKSRFLPNDTDDVLRKYEALFSECFSDILEHFARLESDEKPSVHLEFHKKPLARKRGLKKALEKLGFYVYETDNHDLCVSKIPSIAYWLCQMDNDAFHNNRASFYGNDGAAGVMLGYPLKEVYKYLEKTKAERVLREKM